MSRLQEEESRMSLTGDGDRGGLVLGGGWTQSEQKNREREDREREERKRKVKILEEEVRRGAKQLKEMEKSMRDLNTVTTSIILRMASEQEVAAVGKILVNPKQDLTKRFRALFTLRNLDSALLEHVLAYCLGQMQDERAIPTLDTVLKDTAQEPMVRHEAGEALGAIGNLKVLDLLKEYSEDPVIE
ncbi:unnamed protein product, partial [Coregonus sp. 'balchen']